MGKNKKSLFPTGFFKKERKELSSKKALKDIVPNSLNNVKNKTTPNIKNKKLFN